MATWCENPIHSSALNNFHEEYCREPNFTHSKKHLTVYLREIIDDNLKFKNYCSGVEYAGSCYDGTGVSNSMFDIVAVIDLCGKVHIKMAGTGRYAVKPKEEDKNYIGFMDIVDKDGALSSTKLFSKWKSMLTSITNNSARIKATRIRESDSSFVIQINPDMSSETGNVTINLIPALKLNSEGHTLYVRTSSKEGTWRKTWYLQEKSSLDGIDRGSGCRKHCIRMLKVLSSEQTALKRLTSYMMKTLLLTQVKEEPKVPWTHDHMLERFLGLLRRLEDCLDKRRLTDFFDSKINLLDCGIAESALTNMYHRVKRFRDSEKEFLAAIHAGMVALCEFL